VTRIQTIVERIKEMGQLPLEAPAPPEACDPVCARRVDDGWLLALPRRRD